MCRIVLLAAFRSRLASNGMEVIMTYIDPVCGMLVDPDDDPPQQEFEGHPFYFCSEECKTEFLNHPDRYRNKLAS
jgi:YHS domain-containing protein